MIIHERLPDPFAEERENARRIHAFEGGWIAHQYSVSLAKKIKLPRFDVILKELNSRLVHKDELKSRPDAVPGEYRTKSVFMPAAPFFPPHPERLSFIIPRFIRRVDEEIEKITPKRVIAIEVDKVLGCMSYAYYWICRIHPFREGNGRTAREATDMLCLRFNLPSIFVGPVDQEEYLKALRQVDKTANVDELKADLKPFTLFLARKLARSFPKELSKQKELQYKGVTKLISNLDFQIKFEESGHTRSEYKSEQ